jgi:hypothetical protein
VSLRILHILDHSIPLHSGYTFRTLSILREQRKLGWQTFHLTTPKHVACDLAEESVDGWHFYRTPAPAPAAVSLPGLGEMALMRQVERACWKWRIGSSRISCTPIRRSSMPCRRCASANASACRWFTKCAPSGKTPRWTTAQPARAAFAIASRAVWKRTRSSARPPCVHHLPGPALRYRGARSPGREGDGDSQCGRHRFVCRRRRPRCRAEGPTGAGWRHGDRLSSVPSTPMKGSIF